MLAIPPTPDASQASRSLAAELIIFNIFAFLGLFLNAAVLAPALWSPRIRRRQAWYNQVFAWIMYSITYLLTVGHQIGPSPLFGSCLAQAGLVYASPSLCAVGYAAFVIDFHFHACSMMFGQKEPKQWVSQMVLALPWVVFVLEFFGVILSIDDPVKIERNPIHFYCHISTVTPPLVTACIILVAAVILLSVEVYTARLLYRHWGALRTSNLKNAHLSLSMFLRLLLFTAIVLISTGLDMIVVRRITNNSAGWGIVLTIIPTLAAVVFGTQRDILRAWMFWRQYPATADLEHVDLPLALPSLDFPPSEVKSGGKVGNSVKYHRRWSVQ